LLESGRCNSKSEVLRIIHAPETRLASMLIVIACRLADADAGRVTPAEKVFERLEAKDKKMASS
jgi:antitoxin ParD1/3/4